MECVTHYYEFISREHISQVPWNALPTAMTLIFVIPSRKRISLVQWNMLPTATTLSLASARVHTQGTHFPGPVKCVTHCYHTFFSLSTCSYPGNTFPWSSEMRYPLLPHALSLASARVHTQGLHFPGPVKCVTHCYYTFFSLSTCSYPGNAFPWSSEMRYPLLPHFL